RSWRRAVASALIGAPGLSDGGAAGARGSTPRQGSARAEVSAQRRRRPLAAASGGCGTWADPCPWAVEHASGEGGPRGDSGIESLIGLVSMRCRPHEPGVTPARTLVPVSVATL